MLLNSVAQYQIVMLKLLLFGDDTLPRDINISIFNKVQKYILDTKLPMLQGYTFFFCFCYLAQTVGIIIKTASLRRFLISVTVSVWSRNIKNIYEYH